MNTQDTWVRRVLFVGDSFVAGVGDSTGLGWVGRIVAASFQRGAGLTPYNLGVRMDTSADIAERWLAETRPRVWPGTRPRLVVSCGANDTTAEGASTRVTAQRSVQALADILHGATELRLPTLVVGPPLAGDDAQHDRIRSLSARLAPVCDRHQARFIEVAHHQRAESVWVRQARDGDSSHPDAEGYEELAELLIAAGILDWLAA